MVDDDTLYHIVYVSAETREFSDEQLAELLALSRQNNASLGITGMLLYGEGAFLQVLEGPRDRVEKLYKIISNDDRHAQVMEIHSGELTERLFPDWQMGYRRLNDRFVAADPGFSDFYDKQSSFAELLVGRREAAYRLLLSFRDCSGVVPELE